MRNEIPKSGIRNFFIVRKLYGYLKIISFLVFGGIGIFINEFNDSRILWIPLLFYLLCLCISVELTKAVFQYPVFERKNSKKKQWFILQIVINFLVVVAIMWAIFYFR